MSNETCANTAKLNTYLDKQDQMEQSIEYVVKKNEKLLEEAKDAIFEYDRAMKAESESLDLSTDWWDLTEDLGL